MVLLNIFSNNLKNLPVDAWVLDGNSANNAASSRPINLAIYKHSTIRPTIHSDPNLQRISHQKTRCCMLKNGGNSSSFCDTEQVDSTPSSRLLRLLSPVDSCNVDRLSGTDLAYIGDVVYELFVRSRTVWVSAVCCCPRDDAANKTQKAT